MSSVGENITFTSFVIPFTWCVHNAYLHKYNTAGVRFGVVVNNIRYL